MSIALGDFNIPEALWVPLADDQHSFKMENPNYNPMTTQLSAFMSFTGWQQFNNIPNKNNRQLDLVLSNNSCKLFSVEPLVPIDGHHPVFCINIELRSIDQNLKPASRIIRRFFAADYDIVNAELEKVDWEGQLSLGDIEKAVDIFYIILNTIIDKCIPTKMVNSNEKKISHLVFPTLN